MNFDGLLAKFPPDLAASRPEGMGGQAPASVAHVISVLGGVSLAGGLYRVFLDAEVQRWSAAAHLAFPQFADRATVFAADWLGRLFAADGGRPARDGAPQVLLLEPGSGEALELPVTLNVLHTSELLEAPDAALAAPFYEAWRKTTGDDRPLNRTECVGYRVPLYLGGADEVANLERTDMGVYWALSAQMLEQSHGIPPGTRIGEVSSEPAKRRLFRRGG